MLLCGYAGCSLPSQADDPDLVSDLRFSPSAFDSFKRNTEVRYSLKYPARVSLVIVKREQGREEVVKTLFGGLDESKGTQAHSWLGFPAEPVPAHVQLFEEIFHSFVLKLSDICKGKSEQLIARAERKIGTGNAAPVAKQLTPATAASVLDLIESVVKDVPLLKRSKVKSAALELVAELYNKHHDLLESAGCIDRVEQSYYQLKG